MNTFADFFWAMIVIYFWFMVIWIFIRIFADIFRRQDLSGAMKAIWILALVLIPFLGALIYLVARPKGAVEGYDAMEAGTTSTTPMPQDVRSGTWSSADEIQKLNGLKESGAITQAEFDAAKASALA